MQKINISAQRIISITDAQFDNVNSISKYVAKFIYGFPSVPQNSFRKRPRSLFCIHFFFHILNHNCSKAMKDYVAMFYIRISIHLLFCCLLVQHVSFFIIKSTSNYVMFESRDICHGRGQYFTAILFELPLQ